MEIRGESRGPGQAATGTYVLLLGVAAVVATLDQVTKQMALRTLSDGPVDVVEGIVTLRLTFNSGGAFGLLQGLPGLFLAATCVIVVLILLWARNLDQRKWVTALGLVLGGGIGNLADRLVGRHDGRVVDFIDLHVWPVFNVADSAIVIGVGTLLLMGVTTMRDADEEPARRAT